MNLKKETIETTASLLAILSMVFGALVGVVSGSYAFSSKIEDIIGAGFGLVCGALLFGFGLIAFSLLGKSK